VAIVANDGVRVDYLVAVPTRGLLDGVDPALVEYPEEMAPSLENVRVTTGGTWQTRLGHAAWKTLPGSGAVRLLDNLYQSTGTRTRLAAQGTGAAAALYELKEGTDTNFVAATGGTGLGGTSQNLFQGICHFDRYYFTDRAGVLRKYAPSNLGPGGTHVVTVASPAAPTTAATATPRPWFSHALDWGGGNWTDSNAGEFGDADDTTATPPPPPGYQTQLLTIASTSARGETITHSTAVSNLASHTLAFWVQQDSLSAPSAGVQFDLGVGSPTDYGAKLRDSLQVAGEWFPIFVDIGDLGTANYIRFRVLRGKSGGTDFWVTNIIQPGRLEGEYRWRYTHYDSTNQRESAPSDPTNNGQPLDFSAIGVSWQPTSARAFSKACALRFTSDSGTDSSTDKLRLYRSGGVASLTVDENGNDLWLRVAEIPDYASTLTQLEAAGAGLLHLATVPAALAVGDFLVIEPGTVGKEEYVQITGVSAGTPGTVNVNLGNGANGLTQYSHANGSTVRTAYIDNVANEQIDLTTPIDLRRDNPPSAARFVAKAPDGRLWLFGYSGKPTGIAISNKPTPDRPYDFEVFPDGVDPLTTGSATQGFRVEITGAVAQDEEIMWGGFYLGWPTVLTRRALYVVQAHSQSEWGPTSIQKLHNTGAVSGDSVAEVNGVLYWVADGPRVMRWSGSGAPECVSDLTGSATLNAAPPAYWGQWFARAHTVLEGHTYKLWITPAGATTNTLTLEYNIQRPGWEPVVRYDSGGSAIGYAAAAVRAGNVDSPDLYAVDTSGNVIQTETGDLDGTVPIKVRLQTPKIAMRAGFLDTSLLHTILLRLAAVTDTLTVAVASGGSEYGDQSESYTADLSGSGDKEIKLRCGERTLIGKWIQLTISGDVSNRPALRVISLAWVPWHSRRVTE
jgi:hypothetical protein